MAMVVVDDSCIQADSQPRSGGLVWGSTAACALFCIRQMNRVNSRNGLRSWRQHYKYHPGIIIIIIIILCCLCMQCTSWVFTWTTLTKTSRCRSPIFHRFLALRAPKLHRPSRYSSLFLSVCVSVVLLTFMSSCLTPLLLLFSVLFWRLLQFRPSLPKVSQWITFGDFWCRIFLQARCPSCHPSNSVIMMIIIIIIICRIVRVVRVAADCFGNFGTNQQIGCAVLKWSGPQNHFCLCRW